MNEGSGNEWNGHDSFTDGGHGFSLDMDRPEKSTMGNLLLSRSESIFNITVGNESVKPRFSNKMKYQAETEKLRQR